MPVEFKDYYQTLGVSRTASADEIRKGFRKLARLYHPDVAKDKKNGEAKFKEINEAYEVLSDPEKRKKYDDLGADWRHGSEFRPPPGRGGQWRTTTPGGSHQEYDFHFGGTGFSDFFESLFGGQGGRAGGAQFPGGFPGQEQVRQSQDVEADIMVTLEEALKGSTRQITLQRNGGRSPKVETYQVKIPPGIREDQRIRLAGQGESGGDLFLRVRFARHPDFRVQGSELYYELEIAPWEAVLGTTATISTLESHVALKIAPGTRSGQKLRLKGQGLPIKSGGRGDLIVEVEIQIPKELTAKERTLWEEMAKASTFKPHE